MSALDNRTIRLGLSRSSFGQNPPSPFANSIRDSLVRVIPTTGRRIAWLVPAPKVVDFRIPVSIGPHFMFSSRPSQGGLMQLFPTRGLIGLLSSIGEFTNLCKVSRVTFRHVEAADVYH